MDTQETANFARVACLTMQEGTERIRIKTLENIDGPLDFHDTLESKEVVQLFRNLRSSHVLSRKQFRILYPETGQVDLADIDMSLWLVLARNLTVNKDLVNWSQQPKDNFVLWQHDVIRLREIRNKLFHLKEPKLSREQFQDFCDKVIPVLRNLGTAEEVIQDYLARDLDPEQTKKWCMLVREQCLEEMRQMWLASMHEKRQVKNMVTILTVLTILVVVAIAVPIGLFYANTVPCVSAIKKRSTGRGVLNFLKRAGWGALPRRDLEKHPVPVLHKPVKMAVLFNAGVVESCDVTTDCCATIRYLQEEEYKSNRVHWQDLSYNFLIGNDGVVYEGRGAHYIGGASWHRNREIVSIGFLGNFICTAPSRDAISALYVFLEYIQHADPSTEGNASQPILSHDYKLYGHCQVNLQTPVHNISFPDSPGAAFMHEIRLWDRLSQENMTQCSLAVDCMRPPDCCTPCSTPVTQTKHP